MPLHTHVRPGQYFPENQLGASLKQPSLRAGQPQRHDFPENQLGASLKQQLGQGLQLVRVTSPRTNSGPH